jgi:two-component system, OmpR family, response regulator ResD
MSVSGTRLLVVEDDDAIRNLLIRALQRGGFAVDSAAEGKAALQLTAANQYAVLLVDLMMPGMNGFEFIEAFHAASPAARSVIIVMTASTGAMVGKLDARHVHAVVRKPFDLDQVISTVQAIATTWQAHTEPPSSISAPRLGEPPMPNA